ncbi:MAG: NAD(P)H-hydrate dehydratase [Phototrophicales bacterium]|nr:MAG: NAD(P)H-hydrate dehydratase [Phototrophicales bacterium]
MIKIVTVEKMRQIEAAADASGISYATMMENAGRATALRVLEILAEIEDPWVTILIGPGNNGGDGLVAGRIIAQESDAHVRLYMLKHRSESDDNFAAVQQAGLFVAYAEDDRDFRVLRNLVGSAHLVIDALFGIGLRLPLRDNVVKVLRNVHQALNDSTQFEAPTYILPARPMPNRQRRRTFVMAVDCPSGLDCDTGEIDRYTLTADETITFIAAKPGLLTFPGARAVGQLSVAQIGVPDKLKELAEEKFVLADAHYVRRRLPARTLNSHKGTYGKALIVAGSQNYVGASALAAEAAYRVGAGLVTVATSQPVLASLTSRLTEPTWLPLPDEGGMIDATATNIVRDTFASVDGLLLGPGLGQAEVTQKFIEQLLSSTDVDWPSMVIDADGLNLLGKIDRWWTMLPEHTIVTPHPGEMARLAAVSTSEVQTNRQVLAHEKSAEWGVVVLLKGAHTLIAAPDGRIVALPFKTDALATAGTGDVLAGIIVGLLAQGVESFDAAVVGGYLHGVAGEYAARQHGNSRSVIAGDVLRALPTALTLLENA